MKQSWKPGTTIYPLPAVLVSCGNTPEEYNLITVSWVGTLCTNPPMCYISVRPERHSYEILRKNMEFVINLTTVQMAKATDWCGVSSGKNYNKFEKTGLTPKTAQIVKAPYVEESPLCIECKVREIISLGSHDMFISDVVNILADDKSRDRRVRYAKGRSIGLFPRALLRNRKRNREIRLVCPKEKINRQV